jgi:hypothetical protein
MACRELRTGLWGGCLARWSASRWLRSAPADDRPGPGGGLAGAAFAVQLDHHVGARGGVLLLAADPLVQLSRWLFPSGERARVEHHEHQIQGGWSRLVAALSSGSDRPLAYRFPVTGGHAQAVAGEGFAQRRPGDAQLGGGGVHAAQLFGQGEGAFGFDPVGEEAAGLPAQSAPSGRGQTRRAAWCPDPPPRSPVGKRALPLTPREAARPRMGRLRPGLAFGRAESRSGWRCLRSTGCCTPAVPARWQPGLRVAHRSPRTRGQEQGVCGRLTGGLRLAPDTWAELGVDPDQVAPAVISCWQDGEVTGLQVERPQPRGGSPAHSTGDGPCRGQSRGGKEIMEPASSAGLDGWVRPQHERHGLDSSHAETTQSDYGGQFGRSA